MRRRNPLRRHCDTSVRPRREVVVGNAQPDGRDHAELSGNYCARRYAAVAPGAEASPDPVRLAPWAIASRRFQIRPHGASRLYGLDALQRERACARQQLPPPS